MFLSGLDDIDRRLVELFDRYGLKATFNINSELLGKPRYPVAGKYVGRSQ